MWICYLSALYYSVSSKVTFSIVEGPFLVAGVVEEDG